MNKLFLFIVCPLAGCSSGGSGISPVRNIELTYDVGSGDHTPSYFEDLDEFVKLDGYSLHLKFDGQKITQTAVDANGKENPDAWAALEFPASMFHGGELGSQRARQSKNFHMQGAGKSFSGVNDAEMVLGGKAVGLIYSDFGYLSQSVRGLFSNKSAGISDETVSLAVYSDFTTGKEANLIADTDWQTAINGVAVFNGIALAAVSGKPAGITAANRLAGPAVLELDQQGRVSLDLDFSAYQAGKWNFSDDGSGYKALLNGALLEEGSASVEFKVFGTPKASDKSPADPREVVGSFDYTVDNDNWIAGTFGVKRN